MLLVDTNVWVDAADQDRPHHQACIALLRDRRTDLVTVPMVIAEAGWFIERRLGPAREVTFLRLVARR